MVLLQLTVQESKLLSHTTASEQIQLRLKCQRSLHEQRPGRVDLKIFVLKRQTDRPMFLEKFERKPVAVMHRLLSLKYGIWQLFQAQLTAVSEIKA